MSQFKITSFTLSGPENNARENARIGLLEFKFDKLK
jgi:hypothetical protein